MDYGKGVKTTTHKAETLYIDKFALEIVFFKNHQKCHILCK